ncbi:HEPN domain-containing protein, partial [Hydrogenivirga sp. 128-5-R1-1]|uniref:HEPN domain-containing protein n=1 Tax=Hydrogenivirga sp. 128-5-R1-1 TaxID=392423 RepID=UPI00015F20ED
LYMLFFTLQMHIFQTRKVLKKHSGLRANFHKELIKEGKLDKIYGELYDELFEAREESDYKPFANFETEEVEEWIKLTEKFIKEMERLIRNG